jgi:hypothetical protein
MTITDLSYCELVSDSEISGGEVVSLTSLNSFYDFLKSKGVIVPENMTLERLNEWSTKNGYGATYKVNSTTSGGNYTGILSFVSVSS